jgi:hypothetical protein
MSLVDGDLAALFGAAFAPLYRDAILTKLTPADDGAGGFTTTPMSTPAKILIEAVSDAARAASGIPDEAVTLSVLRAGLGATLDLDDEVKMGPDTYRVIRVATDPAGAAYQAVAVPA